MVGHYMIAIDGIAYPSMGDCMHRAVLPTGNPIGLVKVKKRKHPIGR
jgi:hypothetical protein